MKKKKNNFPVYLFGGKTTDDLMGDYLMQRQLNAFNNPSKIQNPNQALTENNLALARAEQEAANNPWTQGLDMFGNLAMQVGGTMMNKGMSQGQGVSDSGFNWGQLLQGEISTLGAFGNASSQGMATGGVVEDNKLPKGMLHKIYKQGDKNFIPQELMIELMTEKLIGKNPTMLAAMGGVIDGDKVKKKKVQRDLTEEEIAAQVEIENQKDVFDPNETVFTGEGIDALFAGEDVVETPIPDLNLGKYSKLNYFDVDTDAGGRYVLKNTKRNPANAALYKEQLRNIKKLNPGLKFAGVNEGFTALINQHAMGGMVDGVAVEAEGEEIVETPDGKMTELKGPSHENGGIELLLPEGTEIFSKRLKGSDGKTMAERKKAREKQARKLQKLYDKNPSDTVLKKTLDRTLASNEAQEQSDMAMMEQARQHYNSGVQRMMGGLVEHMATGGKIYEDGGTVVGNFLRSIFGGGKNIDPETGFDPDFAASQMRKFNRGISDNANNQTGVLDSNEIFGITDFDDKGKRDLSTNSKQPGLATNPFNNIGDLFGNITVGDGIGLAGNLVSTFGPKKNTLANRAGDTPNINAFENYGKEGLEVSDKSKQYIAGQRDNALQDLELSRNAAIRRGRGSARSVNTQRALDIAANASVNDAKSNVYNNFAAQMMNILGQQAGMENQQDQVVMRGEQARDLTDRQDRDNFYTQLAQDIATQGTGLQHLGKNVNSIKQRGTMSEIFADLFENYTIDPMTGKTKFKKG